MATRKSCLPDPSRTLVEEEIGLRGEDSTSESDGEPIGNGQDRARLRRLLLEGAGSAPAEATDAAWFEGLRQRVHERHGE